VSVNKRLSFARLQAQLAIAFMWLTHLRAERGKDNLHPASLQRRGLCITSRIHEWGSTTQDRFNSEQMEAGESRWMISGGKYVEIDSR